MNLGSMFGLDPEQMRLLAQQYPQMVPQLPRATVNLQDLGYPMPQVSGGVSLPFAGGDVGLAGQFQPNPPQVNRLPSMGGRLEYRRRF